MQLVGIIDAIKYIYIAGVVSLTFWENAVDGADAVGVAHAEQHMQSCACASLRQKFSFSEPIFNKDNGNNNNLCTQYSSHL